MLMHKVISTHGRLIPKPEDNAQERDEVLEEPLTIQDQIENLRTKISLKERYTKVLAEELEESHQGASSVLQDLYYETRDLRIQLMAALAAEKKAVQNAMRTHREFQMAMTDRPPLIAIPWLEDKLFDTIKQFNERLHTLQDKRRRLEDSERMVCMIEKWPVPGSLPWEVAILNKFHRIETYIENIRIKRETAFILYSKYREIKFILRDEKRKYFPALRQFENQLRVQRKELQGLNWMLTEAITFRDESYKSLIATEKDASENRRARRQQMSKMKKAVDKVLAENHVGASKAQLKEKKDDTFADEERANELASTENVLQQKEMELAVYEERAKRVVETMRVQDLTQIPRRYRTVRALSSHLIREKNTKEDVRDGLVKQRDQLQLVLHHFQYTGAKQEDENQQHLNQFEQASTAMISEIDRNTSLQFEYGDAVVDLRLTTVAILSNLDGGNLRRQRDGDIKHQLESISTKSKKLVSEVSALEQFFGDKESDRNFAQFSKQPLLSHRLARVGALEAESESEDDEDIPESNVPGRVDIKAKNQRFKQQAILKRGLK